MTQLIGENFYLRASLWQGEYWLLLNCYCVFILCLLELILILSVYDYLRMSWDVRFLYFQCTGITVYYADCLLGGINRQEDLDIS